MKQENLTDQTAAKSLREAQGKQWLASLLFQRRGRLLPRFALFYQRLRHLPRRVRRGLVRKSAATLAGAALLLALGRTPTSDHIAHAATITVDGATCNLVDAILSAENDTGYGGCDPGSGADTIDLQTDVTLTDSYVTTFRSYTGLPRITTNITIEGNGQTIERDTADPDKFRLLAVSASGNLTLNDVTLSGGYAYRHLVGPGPYYENYYDGDGGAVYNKGTLVITNSILSNNTARERGGALANEGGGEAMISNSTLNDNLAAYDDGGAIHTANSTLTIINSDLHDNTAYYDGGAIDEDGGGLTTISGSTIANNDATEGDGGAVDNDGEMIITDSTISGNEAHGPGGGVWSYGELTITNSTIADNDTTEGRGGGVNVQGGAATITNSTIRDNTVYGNGGGGGVFSRGLGDSNVIITGSTISGNSAGTGGGIFNDYSTLTLTNSTISGNEATYRGGGVFNDESELTITNSTITDNMAGSNGGGVYQSANAGTTTFVRTLVSGNSATGGGSEVAHYNYAGTVTAANHNLFGHDGLTDAQAFFNFAPGATDINATSDGTNVDLADILNTMLADNGGPDSGAPGLEEPILTHALVSGSPAIDDAPSADCNPTPTNGEDQRGYARNVDGDSTVSADECDIGAFEFGSAPAAGDLFMTAAGPGMTADGVAFGKEDILSWDGSEWSKVFDGMDEGLTTTHDIDAIHVINTNDIYLSFAQTKINTTTLGKVFGHDVIHFDGSGFELTFDGSDVGLTTVGEKVDALHILDGSVSPIGVGCDAYLLISTLGTGKVPAFGGGVLNFKGEDILGFCATSLGATTEGGWHLVLDGSAEGMPGNSTDSLGATADGTVIFLTTKGDFDVDSAAGGHSMVYRFDTVTDTFSGPVFSAPANGLPKKVDGLHMEGDLP